jgi:hypothetical protein
MEKARSSDLAFLYYKLMLRNGNPNLEPQRTQSFTEKTFLN